MSPPPPFGAGRATMTPSHCWRSRARWTWCSSAPGPRRRTPPPIARPFARGGAGGRGDGLARRLPHLQRAVVRGAQGGARGAAGVTCARGFGAFRACGFGLRHTHDASGHGYGRRARRGAGAGGGEPRARPRRGADPARPQRHRQDHAFARHRGAATGARRPDRGRAREPRLCRSRRRHQIRADGGRESRLLGAGLRHHRHLAGHRRLRPRPARHAARRRALGGAEAAAGACAASGDGAGGVAPGRADGVARRGGRGHVRGGGARASGQWRRGAHRHAYRPWPVGGAPARSRPLSRAAPLAWDDFDGVFL